MELNIHSQSSALNTKKGAATTLSGCILRDQDDLWDTGGSSKTRSRRFLVGTYLIVLVVALSWTLITHLSYPITLLCQVKTICPDASTFGGSETRVHTLAPPRFIWQSITYPFALNSLIRLRYSDAKP